MSETAPGTVACPRCGASWEQSLFSSVDADTIEAQAAAILDGSFERAVCGACGAAFRPEHPMLFVSHARALWIAMQPLCDRRKFAAIEHSVAQIIRAQLAGAPPIVAERARRLRPRLVFGQHMLTEAVRIAEALLDAALLECAKLFTVRRNIALLFAHGPFELCFERLERGAPQCAIHALPAGERLGELALGTDVMDEVKHTERELRAEFPDLFDRPYVSATRYLLEDTV